METLLKQRNEKLKTREFQHHLLPIGGRIKAAGISMGLLYNEELFPFYRDKTPKAALKTTRSFKGLRDNPPPLIRNAFFPLERSVVKSRTGSSPALFRPILKTDQGPAGNFFPFRITKDSNILAPIQIKTVGGQTILEKHMLDRIKSHRDQLLDFLENIVADFEVNGNEHNTRLAIERFEKQCSELGLQNHREANKGRDSFFFIRPGLVSTGSYLLPFDFAQKIEDKVLKIFIAFERFFPLANDLINRGYPIEEGLNEALLTDNAIPPQSSSLLYFQPDVIIKRDGSFVIDKINFPDVGFFLTKLSTSDGSQYQEISQVVNELKEPIIERIAREVKEKDFHNVVIVTRDEVIDDFQDVLEIMEIETLSESLNGKGIKTQITKISESNQIPQGSMVLLMNVDKDLKGFEDLVLKNAKKEITSYPDPLFYLVQNVFNSYKEITIDEKQIKLIRAVVDNIDYGNENDVYRRMLALQQLLMEFDYINTDIFYFSDGKKTAPAFRYDIRSFALALNDFSGVEKLILRGLDYKPGDSLIYDNNGDRLAAFRFMFIKN